MRRKFFVFIILFIVLSQINSVTAQDTSFITSVVKLDLASAIAYAKQHNIQVNITRLDERLSEQDLLLSRAAKYPDLAGSATQSITHHKGNTNPVVGGFQTQSNLAGNYSLNSSWTLFRGGYLNYDIRSKTLQTEAANLNTSVVQNDITLQLTQAYLSILVAKEFIVYLQDLVKTSQAQYELGKTKFNAGSIAKKDLLQLEAQAASDQYNLVTGENQYRQNIVTLKQILQLPTTTGFTPVMPDTLIVEQALPSLLEAQRLASQNRPEVQYNELQIKIAETELQKARSGYKPTLSAGGSVSTGYSDNQDSKYFNQVNDNLFQRVGLTLSIPIFDNRTNKTNVERSKILIEQSKLTLEQTKTVLDQQVEQAYIAVLNSLAQYKAADVQLKANQQAYDISLEQLRLGAINTVDLLVQRNLYMQSLQNYVQAKYNSILNTKIYEFYMGQPIRL
ncbi:MAG TPA: TolC family protein [Chitinophagaceae bacterium]|jgi:outer membrane protein|nr:TolC family protein [Chitinophagaceae bacterium]